MAKEKTKDFEIRQALREYPYIATLKSEDKDTLLVEEFSLSSCDTRIDLAIFNGSIHGFEIKSDKDTLERLPHQAISYEKVFGYLYIVVGEKYASKVCEMLPDYWGVFIANKNKGIVRLERIRKPKKNNNQDPTTMANMLWRKEVLDILEKYNLAKGIRSKPRSVLCEALSRALDLIDLEKEVRFAIKARGDWRVDLRQKQHDEKSQHAAMLSDYQFQPLY